MFRGRECNSMCGRTWRNAGFRYGGVSAPIRGGASAENRYRRGEDVRMLANGFEDAGRGVWHAYAVSYRRGCRTICLGDGGCRDFTAEAENIPSPGCVITTSIGCWSGSVLVTSRKPSTEIEYTRSSGIVTLRSGWTASRDWILVAEVGNARFSTLGAVDSVSARKSGSKSTVENSRWRLSTLDPLVLRKFR